MGATQQNRKCRRMSRFRRKRQSSNKCTEALGSEITDGSEAVRSAEGEEVDRLLLSSLRFWEVERDLIEERIAIPSPRPGDSGGNPPGVNLKNSQNP